MELKEMKRISALYFQAINEKNKSLIENYLADEIIFNIGYNKEKEYMSFKNPKEHTIHYNILESGDFHKTKTIIFQVAEEDKVVNYFTVEGIHDVIWAGHPPTGNKVRYNALYTFRFENGLIKEIWATGDIHVLMQQIGVL